MPKKWEEMTQGEKIEELHNDVKRIFTLLDRFQAVIGTLESDARSWLAEAEERVDYSHQIVLGLVQRIEENERRMGLR
jgi:hypothetical protein